MTHEIRSSRGIAFDLIALWWFHYECAIRTGRRFVGTDLRFLKILIAVFLLPSLLVIRYVFSAEVMQLFIHGLLLSQYACYIIITYTPGCAILAYPQLVP